MWSLRLGQAVETLEGAELVPVGAILSPAIWDHWSTPGPARAAEAAPLFAHDTVHRDLLDCIDIEPYSIVLGTKRDRARTLQWMAQVRISEPLLAYLDYFKEHDPYTYFHSLKVFALSTRLAEMTGESGPGMQQESTAGPLHDVGKVCVPLQILRKSTPLTRTERGVLEHHAAAGYVLLGHYLGDPHSFFPQVALEHHERRDGSGYPLGHPLTDQMVEIIAISDIYDALLSSRPYQPTPYDNRTALEVLTEMANQGKLSGELVRALICCNRRSNTGYREMDVSKERRGGPPPDSVYGMTIEDS